MESKNFFKENIVLIVGIALPVLLMCGFMLAAAVPQAVSNPPKYDLVFSTEDYQASNHIPVSLQLIVRDGVLKAQYTPIAAPNGYSTSWKKLYLYDHATQHVKALTFPIPSEASKMTKVTEETVEATKGLKLDATLTSADGYELVSDSYYGHSGLITDIFGGSSYSYQPRLRNGAASVKLMSEDGNTAFIYNSPSFIGWVTGKN